MTIGAQASGVHSRVDTEAFIELEEGPKGRGPGLGHAEIGVSVRYPNKVVSHELDSGSEGDLKIIPT